MWDQFDNYEMFEFTHGSPLGQLSSLSLKACMSALLQSSRHAMNYNHFFCHKRRRIIIRLMPKTEIASVKVYQSIKHAFTPWSFYILNLCRHEIARLKITCSDTGALPDESLGHLGHSLSDRY